ncbi:MAG: hypothetical protein CMF22_01130, partial [Idiomarinaceae bacterium]|nr:hypothetical protein [Idiomarinaceae bacterium]
MILVQGRLLAVALLLLFSVLTSDSVAAQGCFEPMAMSTTESMQTSSFGCEDEVARPGPVSSISASPTTSNDGNFTVSWSAASNMETSGFNSWGYQLNEYKNGSLTQTFNLSPTATSHSFSDKSNGSYYYTVRGCNQSLGVPLCGSTSSASNTVTVNLVVSMPSSISGPTSTDTDGAFTISWGASATSSVTYELQERFKPYGASSYQNWVSVYSGSALSKSRASRADGEWDYRVRACGSSLCSDYKVISPKITVLKKPSAPTNVSIPSSSANGSYTLSWSGSVGQVTRYEYAESSNFSSWVSVSTATSKAFSGRLDGSWSYRVRACNASGCSPYASSSTVTVAHPTPAAPSQVTAPVETSLATYAISWDASTSSYVDRYQFASRHESGNWSAWSNATGTSGNATVDQSGNWTHKVVACNVLPDGSAKCSASATLSNTVNVQLPAPWAQAGGTVSDDLSGALFSLSHDPEVGAVQAEPGVSGGAATYRLPIAVPPGRNGMTPSVALSYSSRAGNGVAGVGWNITAGGSIQRCAATPAQDGNRLAPTLKATDKLCLNGNRLMVVSGSYGQSGATYRTEQDQFLLVIQSGSLNGSSSFTVRYPNNRIGYFGTTTDSRRSVIGSTVTASWSLAREQDASGNTINYYYTEPVEGEHLLSEILYTGFNATPGTRKVTFLYEPRPDTSRRWQGGGLRVSTHRLRAVATEVNQAPVREYTLTYESSAFTQRSLLRSVTECAGGYCLPATQLYTHAPAMNWQASDSSSAANRALTPSGVTAGLDRVKQKDLNGDGVPEAIYMHAQFDSNDQLIGFNVQVYYQDPVTGDYSLAYDGLDDGTAIGNGIYHYDSGDLNRDGITDFFIVDSNRNVSLYQFDDNLQQLPLISTNLMVPQSFVDAPAYVGQTMQIVDITGDGHQDIAYVDSDDVLYYFQNMGVINGAPEFTGPYAITTLDTFYFNGTQRQKPRFTDIDGDGVQDILLTWQNGVSSQVLEVAFGTVTSAGAYQVSSPLDASQLGLPTNTFYNEHTFADVNGDGLDDFIRPVKVAGGFDWAVRENRGDRTFDSERLLGTALGIHEHIAVDLAGNYYLRVQPLWGRGLRVADIDSDGAAELLVATDSSDDVCVEFTGNPNSSGSFEPYGLMVCNDDMHERKAELYSHPGSEIDIDFGRYDIRRFNWSVIDVAQAPSGLAVGRVLSDVVSAPMVSFVDINGNYTSGLAIKDVNNDGFDDFSYSVMASYAQGASQGEHITVAGTPYYMATLNVSHTDASPSVAEGYYEQLNDATIGVNSGKLVDTNTQVVNGLGHTYEWAYHPLSRPLGNRAGGAFYQVPGFGINDERYVTNDEAQEHFYFTSSMYVVSDTLESNGVGGLNETEYNYREAVYNAAGRGFQGFRQIIVDTKATGRRAVTDFHQIFPLTGKVESLYTCLISDNDLCTQPLSEKTYSYDNTITTAGGSVWVYPTVQQEREYALNSRGTVLNEKVTTVADADVDAYGNVAEMTVITDNGFHEVKTTITSTFDSSYTTSSSWWPHKLSARTKSTETLWRAASSAPVLPEADTVQTTTVSYGYGNGGTTHRKPTSVTTTASGTSKSHQVSHVFNQYGLPTSTQETGSGSTSDLTRVNSFSYSSDGYFVSSATNDKGHQQSQVVSAAHGKPLSETDANGITVNYTYDPFGRKTGQTVPGGAPIETGLIRCYSCESSAASYYQFTQQEGSPLQKVFFDLLNRERMTSVTGFGGTTVYTRTDYNARGDKTFESLPSYSTNGSDGTSFLAFDALGRVTLKETDRGENGWITTRYTYNGHQTSIEATDGTTLYMSRTYGGDGKLVQTVDARNGTTRYAYDSAGNPITLQDAKNASIYAIYNGFGHKTEVRDPNMGTRMFSYNTFGEVEFETDAEGVVTQTIYDGLGRVVTRKVSGAVQASYTYDTRSGGIGLPSSHSGGGQQAAFYYDSLSRMVQKETTIDGTTYTSRTEFDSNYGRVKAIEHASGIKVAYEYDPYGNILKVKNAGSGFVYQENVLSDALQNITYAEKNNGTLFESRTYDQVSGQLKQVSAASAVGNELHYLAYYYGRFGNLDSQTMESNNGAMSVTESYSYDDLHRLTGSSLSSGGSISYSYDATGNLTQKSDYASSMTYGSSGKSNAGNAGPNAVLSATLVGGGSTSFSYDNNGNLISGAGKTITYNALNKPTQITAGGSTVNFAYDANWQRFKKTVSGNRTVYYIDDSVEVEQVDDTT